MPLYMTQASYTSEAWAALARQPENRAEAVSALAKKFNARLVDLFFSFGEYDVVVLVDAPDDATIAAMMVAASSAGHLRGTKTTRLLTVDEGLEVMRKAGGVAYAPPAGMKAAARA